jgi:hypothetical protein
VLIAPTPLPILAPLLPYFGTDVDATATMAETKKPTVRFAIPKKPKKRPPFSVRRVYSAILLVWVVLVMGFVRMGRDRAGLVRDAVGTGKGLARRAPGEDAVAGRVFSGERIQKDRGGVLNAEILGGGGNDTDIPVEVELGSTSHNDEEVWYSCWWNFWKKRS